MNNLVISLYYTPDTKQITQPAPIEECAIEVQASSMSSFPIPSAPLLMIPESTRDHKEVYEVQDAPPPYCESTTTISHQTPESTRDHKEVYKVQDAPPPWESTTTISHQNEAASVSAAPEKVSPRKINTERPGRVVVLA